MTSTEMELLINRVLVEMLSDQIVARLRARQRRGLVLFSGSSIGLSEALASLRKLQGADAGFVLTPVFAPKFAMQVGESQWQAAGGEAVFGALSSFATPDRADFPDLLANAGLLIVPTLSVTLAAKVALGLQDCPASALVGKALEKGVRIVAARNGVCPDNRERKAQGFAANEAYRAMLAGHLATLQSFGVELTSAHRLAECICCANAGTRADVQQPAAALLPSAKSMKSTTAGRRIFGRADALQHQDEVLRLAPEVLVTPLAAEELRKRHVRVITG